MPLKYLIAFIPADKQSAADAKLATDRKTVSKPKAGHSNFVVPLSATGSAPATHYGCCWAVGEREPIATDLAAFKSLLSEAEFQVVADKFDWQTHWLDWLAGHGMTVSSRNKGV